MRPLEAAKTALVQITAAKAHKAILILAFQQDFFSSPS